MCYPFVMPPDWSHQITVSAANGQHYLAVLYPDHPAAWPNGYVYSHRAVMEEKIGRFLTADEIVHHLDENKLNNDPSNLVLTTQADHAREHKLGSGNPPLTFTCEVCNTPFQRPWRDRSKPNRFCSNRCRFAGIQPPSQTGKTWKQRPKGT